MAAPPGTDPGAADPRHLDIAVSTLGDRCTVTVTGDVDPLSAPVLADRLLQVLARPDAAEVELDLRAVTFLDSAGLTALVVAHQSAERAGRVLRMRCGSTRPVLRPLQITGLATVFTLVDDSPSAQGGSAGRGLGRSPGAPRTAGC